MGTARIALTLTLEEENILERAKSYAKAIGVGYTVFLALIMDCYLRGGEIPNDQPIIDLPPDTLTSENCRRKYIQLSGQSLETAKQFLSHAGKVGVRPGRLLALLILAAGENLAHARIRLDFDGATSTKEKAA